MCGIAGFFRPHGLGPGDDAILRGMTDAIARRGPDGDGHWTDGEAGIALGHRRLAIIDLTDAGRQPMASADGRFVLTYNGEIYNFEAMRRELEDAAKAPNWRGHSDTEVLVAAFDAWGIEATLRRAVGMFAIALWDRQSRTLTLARDRLGEKPLYWGWQGSGAARTLLFGSELAALRVHPAFEAEIDPAAVELLLRFLYVPEPYSVYRGIGKLMPGCFTTIHADAREPESGVYWDALEVAARARSERFSGSPGEAIDCLETTLGDAVERQMVSDVPLGAFLSGGIDSSAITALMQERSVSPVKTFTIGFAEKAFDESEHARAVAAHLGTDHCELLVTQQDARNVIPDLPSIYSEPFADSSQIPTFLVSRLAREQVTVALSGDGGDEVFGGYNRHVYAHQHWPRIARVPRPLRSVASRMMLAVSPGAWDRAVGPVLQHRARQVGDKVHKSAEALASPSVDALYRHLIAINPRSRQLMLSADEHPPFVGRRLELASGFGSAERMMALDTVHYLPGDVLVKVDRAAMAVSLETRVPLLDPDVVRFAWSLPIEYKIRGGASKWPLRQLLHRYVPRELVERPKMGFALPIDDWLRGELRDWAESLLERKSVSANGLFDPDQVCALWGEHLSGARNHGHRLWPLLMVQAWLASEQQAKSQGPQPLLAVGAGR